MKIFIYFLFILLCPISVFAEGWLTDGNTHCQVWNDVKDSPDLSVEWSGECLNGKASGNGDLKVYYIGQVVTSYEGEYQDGHKNGKGIYKVHGKHGIVEKTVDAFFKNDIVYDSKDQADRAIAQKTKDNLEQDYAAAVEEKCMLTPECVAARKRAEREQRLRSYLSPARSYCFQIKDEDGRNGCMAGTLLAEDNLSQARGYCFQIKDEDGRNGCMAGTLLAEDNLSQARGYCFQIKDEDGRNGCMAGTLLAEDNLSQARGYCFQIKNEDGRNGCMSGTLLAEDNLSQARGYCFQIKNEDGRNDCLSGTQLTEYFSQKEQYDLENDTGITNSESKVSTIENKLSHEKQEIQDLIKEIEANPELLANPETRRLYNRLK